MASKVDIANSALIKLGASRIASFSENTPEARLMTDRYDNIRDSLLRSHPWNFAVKRSSLTRITTVPEYGYAYKYLIPSDSLRILNIINNMYQSTDYTTWAASTAYAVGDLVTTSYNIVYECIVAHTSGADFETDYKADKWQIKYTIQVVPNVSGSEIKYEVENGELLTDSSSVKVRYIFKNEDVNTYDSIFKEVLAYKLAIDLCIPIVNSTNLKQQLVEELRLFRAEAMSYDAQENYETDYPNSDDFLNSRYT